MKVWACAGILLVRVWSINIDIGLAGRQAWPWMPDGGMPDKHP
jgi:hypothetical protein